MLTRSRPRGILCVDTIGSPDRGILCVDKIGSVAPELQEWPGTPSKPVKSTNGRFSNRKRPLPRIWVPDLVQDLGYRIWNHGKISAAGGPAEAAPGLPPSMHPHPPTLTHLHMSTRLTLIHPDCHLLGKNKLETLFILLFRLQCRSHCQTWLFRSIERLPVLPSNSTL